MGIKRQNILITCAGSGSSVYLARRLKKNYRIFLADAEEGLGSYLGFPFSRLPYGNHPSYSAKLRKLIEKWQIDCIVPGADEELLPVSELISAYPKIKAVIPARRFIELCLDKKALMEELARSGISYLLPFNNIRDIRFPAAAKPIFGRGSRQFHVVDNKIQMQGYLKLYNKSFAEILVQPYIPGTEYTVSVIVNNRNAIIGIVPKRVIVKKGITRVAVAETNNKIIRVCRRIVEELAPAGPFNVQLKLWRGKIYIFEINPRLSTTSVLTDRSFGNEVELYLRNYDKETLANLPRLINNIFLYRYEDNVFVK